VAKSPSQPFSAKQILDTTGKYRYCAQVCSYHSFAVSASVSLFGEVFGKEGLTAFAEDEGGGPDLAFYQGDESVGFGEVKTLTGNHLTQLSVELHGKGKFRVSLPKGRGLWSVWLDPQARVNDGRRILKKYLSDAKEHSAYDESQIEIKINKVGFRFLRHHPGSDGDGDQLILTQAPRPYTPLEDAIEPAPLFDFFQKKLSHKESVRTVREAPGPHRHIFLWPCETEFPEEVFAAYYFPTTLPRPLQRSLQGFTHLWIGHKYSLPEGGFRAWMYSENDGWTVVEAPPS